MSVDELWALHVKTGQVLAARLEPERQSWKRGSNKSVNALLQKIKSRSLLLSGGVGAAGRSSRGWRQRGFRPGCGSASLHLVPLTVPTNLQPVGAGRFNRAGRGLLAPH
jgi:hypothetical protein